MRSFRMGQGALLASKGALLRLKGCIFGCANVAQKVRLGCVLGAFLGGCIYPHTPYAFGSIGCRLVIANFFQIHARRP
jgi:hypothetical protein